MFSREQLKKLLESKSGRKEIVSKISDLAYFGNVGELIKKLEKKGEVDALETVIRLRNGADTLLLLVTLCFEKIEKLENRG